MAQLETVTLKGKFRGKQAIAFFSRGVDKKTGLLSKTGWLLTLTVGGKTVKHVLRDASYKPCWTVAVKLMEAIEPANKKPVKATKAAKVNLRQKPASDEGPTLLRFFGGQGLAASLFLSEEPMAENSKIEWTHYTFNPWRGCAKVHTGCANCYAESQAKRNPGTLGIWGANGSRVVASEEMWAKPLKWDKAAREAGQRHRVFCASMADVFEDWQGPMMANVNGPVYLDRDFRASRGEADRLTMDDVRRRLFELIDDTPNLDWLLLTKRPENVRQIWPEYSYHACVTGDCPHDRRSECDAQNKLFRDNVWLGTSISDQQTADKTIPELLKCRDLSPVLFLSAEPLVGPISLVDMKQIGTAEEGHEGEYYSNVLTGHDWHPDWEAGEAWNGPIDWVIVGGESGHNARPCGVEWIRSIRDQCQAAGVPVFIKQLGAMPVPEFITQAARAFGGGTVQVPAKSPLKDPKGGDWDEWPEDLRVREFPRAS